jgi:hypothetical protein
VDGSAYPVPGAVGWASVVDAEGVDPDDGEVGGGDIDVGESDGEPLGGSDAEVCVADDDADGVEERQPGDVVPGPAPIVAGSVSVGVPARPASGLVTGRPW